MNNKTGVFFIYLNLRHILQNVIIVEASSECVSR